MPWLLPNHLLVRLTRSLRRRRELLLRPLFGGHGARFHFDPDGMYSFANITVGDDVTLGMRPVLMAADSRIRIGSHVMFGPQVAIIAGNHNTRVVGRFMSAVHEKRPDDDIDVVIEDDVWVGTRAIILRGVTIGRGSVIGAGSVVTRSIPPYAVIAGNPARLIRFRWDAETIRAHERALYPPERRLAPERIDHILAATRLEAPRRGPPERSTP